MASIKDVINHGGRGVWQKYTSFLRGDLSKWTFDDKWGRGCQNSRKIDDVFHECHLIEIMKSAMNSIFTWTITEKLKSLHYCEENSENKTHPFPCGDFSSSIGAHLLCRTRIKRNWFFRRAQRSNSNLREVLSPERAPYN